MRLVAYMGLLNELAKIISSLSIMSNFISVAPTLLYHSSLVTRYNVFAYMFSYLSYFFYVVDVNSLFKNRMIGKDYLHIYMPKNTLK